MDPVNFIKTYAPRGSIILLIMPCH
ncbi:CPXV094 protein [Cowpox virus]|uniref:CPXV094 protein n=1 Tax=Cowpox virus TaxID=10243 RepID=A0A290GI43_COWPX|nr:CPXV094 protein [Cowpox virus]ATB55572.1 CPXV094 protein [Cowpox virus]